MHPCLGPQKDQIAARNFILNMFQELVPEKTMVYPHFTCATGKADRPVF